MKITLTYLITVLVFAAILSGCNKTSEQQPSDTIQTERGDQDTVAETENPGEETGIENQDKVTKTKNETASKTTLLDAEYDYESNTFSIKNLETNDITGTYKFEQSQFLCGITPFDNGFIMLSGTSEEKFVTKKSDGIQINMPKEFDSFYLYVFDSSAKLQKTCKITDEDISYNDLLTSSITSSNVGTTLAIGCVWNIWLYDISAGSAKELIQSKDNDIGFERLAFSPSGDKLTFYGSDPRHEEGSLTYGMIDLKTKKITSFTKEKYSAWKIQCMDTYAVISESIKPDGTFSGSTSGTVLILNLINGKNEVFSVDGTESGNAVITSDGKYLFTVKDKENGTYLLRCYNTSSSKIIQEKEVSSKDESKIGRLIVNGTDAYLVLYTKNGLAIKGQISAKEE